MKLGFTSAILMSKLDQNNGLPKERKSLLKAKANQPGRKVMATVFWDNEVI